MKKFNLILVVLMLLVSGKIYSQGMVPPNPIKSAFIDASLGTWVSEPYDMMGMKMTDEVTHKMILNGQFMEIDVKGTGQGFTYEAKGIIAPSADGTLTGWFFDIFGKDGIGNYTGTANGTSVNLLGSGNWGTEKRNITIDGDTMIHDVTFNFKDPSGKDTPPMTMVIKYKKKN